MKGHQLLFSLGRVRTISWVLLAGVVCFTTAALAQDPLREEQYKSLKGLPEITVIIHQPNDSDGLPALIATLGLDPKALGDLMKVAFSKNVPSLRLSDKFQNDKPYLEISWFGNAAAMSLSMNLWRWTRIQDTNESVFATVWSAGTLFISPNRQRIRDKLDDFATAFAADYLRANPPRTP
jgi:hypothetical protein